MTHEINGDACRVYWHGSDVNDGTGWQAVIDRVVRVADDADITDALEPEELNAISALIEDEREGWDDDTD